MRPVFLDTVGLIAVWDEDDQWHEVAAEVYADLKAKKAVTVTTPYVLAECANAAARRKYRGEVAELRAYLEQRKRVLFPSDVEWRQAWYLYDNGRAGSPGLVDNISFLTMRRCGLRQAFTNDQHFRAAGFETLF